MEFTTNGGIIDMLRAGHYDEAVERLVADPIIIAMAHGLATVDRDSLVHPRDDEGPEQARFEFMQMANAEYAMRGGANQAHVGAVSEALLILI